MLLCLLMKMEKYNYYFIVLQKDKKRQIRF